MTQRLERKIKSASIDLGKIIPKGSTDIPESLIKTIISHITSDPGICICYGARDVLSAQGLDIQEGQDLAYDLHDKILGRIWEQIDLAQFSVTNRSMTIAKMDVDGFKINGDFSHDSKIDSRAFMTTKCLHFDAATPFVANIYGINKNIIGGYPVLCDVQAYCKDHNLTPVELVKELENNYNIAIREDHYESLVDGYSVGLDVDLESDVIMILFLNEVTFGIAHGATPPSAKNPGQPTQRPIRHYEYQYMEDEHYDEWYEYYKIPMVSAHDYAGENLSLNFYDSATRPFDRLVPVGSALNLPSK